MRLWQKRLKKIFGGVRTNSPKREKIFARNESVFWDIVANF